MYDHVHSAASIVSFLNSHNSILTKIYKIEVKIDINISNQIEENVQGIKNIKTHLNVLSIKSGLLTDRDHDYLSVKNLNNSNINKFCQITNWQITNLVNQSAHRIPYLFKNKIEDNPNYAQNFNLCKNNDLSKKIYQLKTQHLNLIKNVYHQEVNRSQAFESFTIALQLIRESRKEMKELKEICDNLSSRRRSDPYYNFEKIKYQRPLLIEDQMDELRTDSIDLTNNCLQKSKDQYQSDLNHFNQKFQSKKQQTSKTQTQKTIRKAGSNLTREVSITADQIRSKLTGNLTSASNLKNNKAQKQAQQNQKQRQRSFDSNLSRDRDLSNYQIRVIREESKVCEKISIISSNALNCNLSRNSISAYNNHDNLASRKFYYRHILNKSYLLISFQSVFFFCSNTTNFSQTLDYSQNEQ